jgi:hypothetical protein
MPSRSRKSRGIARYEIAAIGKRQSYIALALVRHMTHVTSSRS